jgi:hypothetical protein
VNQKPAMMDGSQKIMRGGFNQELKSSHWKKEKWHELLS